MTIARHLLPFSVYSPFDSRIGGINITASRRFRDDHRANYDPVSPAGQRGAFNERIAGDIKFIINVRGEMERLRILNERQECRCRAANET